MKRNFLGITAILAAGLLFFACSGTTSSGGGGNADDPDNGGGGNVDNPIDGGTGTGTGAGTGTVQTPTAADVSNASVNIVKSEDLFNSAYIIFEQVEGAVYEVLADDVKIDDALIRYYDEYVYHEYDEENSKWTKKSFTKVCRADALGLTSGSHTLKVCAVGTQNKSEYSSATMTVADKDRSGFAFTGSSIPGAYNADGTLKSGAVVLYINESTKDSVSLDVVTSSKGATTACTGLQNILNAFKKGYDNRPLCVRIIGRVTDFATMDNGDIMISGSGSSKHLTNGITVEGIGSDATAYGWGIRIKNADFIEISNIGFMMVDSGEGDNVSLQQDCKNVWVHNCDMFYGAPGGDKDQAKGDGALDCKKSTYVTFSYNHFWDSGKCNLLGLSEGTTDGLYITYHHNWYDHSDSRHPRVRYYSAHVYNNYYDGCAKYGAGACLGSSIFMESNYFRNTKNPMMISMQGTDLYAGSKTKSNDNATFSKEAGGMIKAYGNQMTGTYYFVPYGGSAYHGGSSTTDFDAYVVTNKSSTVPSSVKSASGSNTYNNFDTELGLAGLGLAAVPSDAETAKSYVVKYAGRYQSDFAYNFDNGADDADYGVNSALKALVVNYENKLTAVQGLASSGSGGSSGGDSGSSGDSSGTSDPVSGGSSTDVPTGSAVVALVENGAVAPSDSRVTAIGSVNGSEKNGAITITYGGTEYTTMKMESSSSITVKAAAGVTITVVGSLPSGKQSCFKLNGTAVKLDAKTSAVTTFEKSFTATGNDVITKGDTASIGVIVISE